MLIHHASIPHVFNFYLIQTFFCTRLEIEFLTEYPLLFELLTEEITRRESYVIRER